MTEHLRFVLTLTNEWLRFAEAKNGVALAFVAAVVGVYTRSALASLSGIAKLAIEVAIVCFAIAALSALTSFIPQIKLPVLDSRRQPESDDNLLFYGHLASYRPTELLTITGNALGVTTHQNIDEQYAAQIVINARITLKKYNHFSLACWSLLVGLLLIAAGELTNVIV